MKKMTSEPGDIERTEEQKKLDQFEKLCKSVKDNIGFSDIEHKIDQLGQMVGDMIRQVGDTSQKVEQMIPHINRWIQLENGTSQTTTTGTATQQTQAGMQGTLTQMPPEAKLQMMQQMGQGLAEIIKGLADAYRTFKGQDAPPSSFLGIDENVIKENIKESILGDFETGKAMREMLTGGLKRKVVNKAVTQMLETDVVHTLK